jgi:hypothetical protein
METREKLKRDVIKIVDRTTGSVVFEGSRAFYRFEFNTMDTPEHSIKEFGHSKWDLYINEILYVNEVENK